LANPDARGGRDPERGGRDRVRVSEPCLPNSRDERGTRDRSHVLHDGWLLRERVASMAGRAVVATADRHPRRRERVGAGLTHSGQACEGSAPQTGTGLSGHPAPQSCADITLFAVLHLAERANLGLAWQEENHGFCNEARERPAGSAGRAAVTPKPNLSSRPCLSGQGMQHEAFRLQRDGHMRDPRGTAAFPTTLRLGTQGEGRTEASDGGAGRAPRVDPRPRGKHQHSLAPTRTGVLR